MLCLHIKTRVYRFSLISTHIFLPCKHCCHSLMQANAVAMVTRETPESQTETLGNVVLKCFNAAIISLLNWFVYYITQNPVWSKLMAVLCTVLAFSSSCLLNTVWWYSFLIADQRNADCDWIIIAALKVYKETDYDVPKSRSSPVSVEDARKQQSYICRKGKSSCSIDIKPR